MKNDIKLLSMKVITLNSRGFEDACSELASKVFSDITPLAVIGIKSGGYIVAENVLKVARESIPQLTLFGVSASRTTSQIKKKVKIYRFFKLLPVPVLNAMRLVEHLVLSVQMLFCKHNNRHVTIDSDLETYIKNLSEGVVLVVDDAIDSGSTIKSVLDDLNKINPQISYYVAVLVVTQSSPLVQPCASLYENVLLRFPWANDFKG